MNSLLYFTLVVILLLRVSCSNGQNALEIKLEKTKETIEKYKTNESRDFGYPIGFFNNSPIYLYKDKEYRIKFFLLNENDFSFREIFKQINLNGQYLHNFIVRDSIICYQKSQVNLDFRKSYSELIFQKNQKSIILDSINDSDKRIHFTISSYGNLLVANSLILSKDYYNPAQDDRFMIYNLDSAYTGKLKKNYKNCYNCSDGFIINDKLFFTKAEEIQEFNNEFGQTNIYMALGGHLKDSIKIASSTDIVAISPNGKYVLAERLFDLPNRPLAIIDVENKKYQLLLGRKYSAANAFYSYKKEKFAFHFGDKIIYIDFPKEYPFDALRKNNPDIPHFTDKEFYKKFIHSSFD